MRTVLLGVIGDLHDELERLDRVLARIRAVGADGILLVGDFSSGLGRGRNPPPERRQRWRATVDRAFARLEATGLPWAFVPGNHDLPDLPHPRNADGVVLEVGGLRVFGIGGAGPARFGFAYEWGEAHVRGLPEPACEVLLLHAPPVGTRLDRTHAGLHVGSVAIRERLERHAGLAVCGHIHESPGVEALGACLALNAGGLGRPFGRTQVGFARWRPDGRHEAWHEDLDAGGGVATQGRLTGRG